MSLANRLSHPARNAARAVRMLGVGLALAGCAAGDDVQGTPDVPGGVAPGTPAPVAQDIGPAGGTLTHSSGAKIVVPPGALSAIVHLTLEARATPNARALSATALGQSFEAGPEGQTFLKPVDVVLPFDPARVPAGTDPASAQVRMGPHDASSFAALESEVDVAQKTIRTRTVHFTQFVPAVNPNPVFITGPTTLPDATVGVPYARPFSAAGGTLPYTWSLSPGSMVPAGLSLSSGGSIGGMPTATASLGFFVTVADSAGHAVQKAYSIVVNPANNPVPSLSEIAPGTVQEGGATLAIDLTGSGFVPASVARWDGNTLATTFVSESHLAASVSDALLATAGTHYLSITSPAPGGGGSGTVAFVITAIAGNPIPNVSSVAPLSLPASTVDTQITITGTNFIASSSATIGAQGIPTLFVSDTHLEATIPASYLDGQTATLVINVYNPPPGGGFSGSETSIGVTGGSPSCTCPPHEDCGTSCSGPCTAGWFDLDQNPANGCETDITSSVTCITRTTSWDCSVATTIENDVKFSFAFYNGDWQGAINSSSPGIASIYNGGTPQFTATSPAHTNYVNSIFLTDIARSGNTFTIVKLNMSRGPIGSPQCPTAHYSTRCAGTTAL
jgi:hypothetical protein